MAKRYIVRLTKTEQNELKALVSKGKAAAYKIKHANILLQSDANGANMTDEKIAISLHCHSNTVCGVRQRFVEGGITAAIERKTRKRPPRQKVLDGEAEARLITLACSEAPQGHARWTLSLLAEKMVELKIVESISTETVRQGLKKRAQTTSSPMLGYSA